MLGQLQGLQRNRAIDIVESQDHKIRRTSPLLELISISVMADVLISISDHRPPSIPSPTTDNVHLGGEEGVRRAYHRSDIEVVLQVLDCNVEGMPAGIQLFDDGFQLPIAKLIHHISAITRCEQLLVQARVHRPRQGVWANSHGRIMEIHVSDDSLPK